MIAPGTRYNAKLPFPSTALCSGAFGGAAVEQSEAPDVARGPVDEQF